jgi:guanosine-3',5'-bis(diphosphate) 3'-pyrophosphohydrolase
MEINSLIAKAREYLPADRIALIESAYQFAAQAHEGQTRKSGEPYVQHPLEVATTLADLQLDADTLAAALLHDVVEDCCIPLHDIEESFGPEIAKLVDSSTKLNAVIKPTREEETRRASQTENLRKMLIAMAEDLRVVFIKLADRLHNMRTLHALPVEKRRAIARETLDIYAPLAHRLGIWAVKWQLEDLAFRFLEPRQYHQIARLVSKQRAERESFITEASRVLAEGLSEAGMKARVSGRPKHIYSTYQKMCKYSTQGKDFGDIHDLFAVRVLVDKVSDCYKALGIIHSFWHPIPEEFDDLIANPKDNGYRSLHTTVMCQGTTPLEVQIRTYEMHQVNEYGVAAHWSYKEEKVDKSFDNKIAWLRQLIEWQKELSSEEFLESVKTDILIDRVFVFTPKGEIKDLPRGATPLDFAFRIHTDLGYRCVGAKVNGRLVPFSHALSNGDVVEIMAAKGERGPSLDWLNPELGYIKTSHAQTKVRQWFNKQERTQNIEAGKHLFEKEVKRLGIESVNFEEIAGLFGYESPDDFFASLGCGNISPTQVALKLTASSEQPQEMVETLPPHRISPSSIKVLGTGDLLTYLANCCHPLPGDKIIGYITQGRGIAVHRKDCVNITNELEKERLIGVTWGDVEQVYPVTIQIDAWDRVGLLRDITVIVAAEGVNINSANLKDNGNNTTSISLTLEIKDLDQLTSLTSKIYQVWGVTSVARKGRVKVSIGARHEEGGSIAQD